MRHTECMFDRAHNSAIQFNNCHVIFWCHTPIHHVSLHAFSLLVQDRPIPGEKAMQGMQGLCVTVGKSKVNVLIMNVDCRILGRNHRP